MNSMKLRLRHNSIRLRLTQSEVREFAENGSVEDGLEFGANTKFRYRLERSPEADSITANFKDGRITITVPENEGMSWAGSDQVGLRSLPGSDGVGILSILIEKDFACLEPRGSEDDDAFPNPRKCGSDADEILEHRAK
jgi:hypothetical protein